MKLTTLQFKIYDKNKYFQKEGSYGTSRYTN